MVRETKAFPGGRLKTKERKANAPNYGTHSGMMLQGSKVQRVKRQENVTEDSSCINFLNEALDIASSSSF